VNFKILIFQFLNRQWVISKQNIVIMQYTMSKRSQNVASVAFTLEVCITLMMVLLMEGNQEM
jgi:hypothetical protein